MWQWWHAQFGATSATHIRKSAELAPQLFDVPHKKKSTRRTNKPTHIFMDSKYVSHYKQVYPCIPSGMTSFFAAAEHGDCWSAHCATTWQLMTGNHAIICPKLEEKATEVYVALVRTPVLCLLRSQSLMYEWPLSLLAFLFDWIFNAFPHGNIFIWIGSFSSISGVRGMSQEWLKEKCK